jgi:hypothetical protein
VSLALPHSIDAGEMRRFLDTFLYREEAFLLDEIVAVDRDAHTLHARTDTNRELPISRYQRVGPGHPAHVSAADVLTLTGNLGCLHAWIFHGCRWDEGWSGFGNRIHRADWRRIARIGPPLELFSSESRTRGGPKRVVIRFEFRFEQDGEVVYRGDQSAMFFRDAEL